MKGMYAFLKASEAPQNLWICDFAEGCPEGKCA
jgi:hypothetical protein